MVQGIDTGWDVNPLIVLNQLSFYHLIQIENHLGVLGLEKIEFGAIFILEILTWTLSFYGRKSLLFSPFPVFQPHTLMTLLQ